MPASRPPRVLVTRSARQSSALADRLRELGAEPVLIPTIEIVEPESFATLDEALADLAGFDWVVFTSANAVEAFHARRMQVHQAGARRASVPRIAAIGQMTARALTHAQLRCDLLPAQAVAESLAEALLPHVQRPNGAPARFLLVRAEEAREHLPDTLRAAGAAVTIAPVYRTVIPEASIGRLQELFAGESTSGASAQKVDAVTFTSASTVRNLLALLHAARCTLPAGVVRASIGPITSAALAEEGLPAHVEAEEATVASLAEAVMRYLARP